jgi:hypothetical protein
MDGFKDEIKSVILVQHPIDLDTATNLALLQEEAVTDRRKELRKPEFVFKPRTAGTSSPLPLSLPPPRTDSSLGAGAVECRGATTSIPVLDNSSDGKVRMVCVSSVRKMGTRPQVRTAGSVVSSLGVVGHALYGF